ncbi:MAG: MBL fold metallo-hydrolase [Bacillota bacterium]|nr:MBL fold metallo-hydrolase [Bacillota bacterium]
MKIYNLPSGALQVNTYLAFDEETNKGFIVDPGGYNPVLTKKVKEENIDIEYIILTHGHSDHICGVNEHKEEFEGAKVIAHAAEEAMLKDIRLNCSADFGMPYVVDADMYVNDGDEITIGNIDLKFFHTPGHTVGGMCIYAPKDNILFSGDTLFSQSIGRTDFPGGSFKEIAESIKNKLFTLPDETAVLPGHMGTTQIGFEKRNNPFVHI